MVTQRKNVWWNKEVRENERKGEIENKRKKKMHQKKTERPKENKSKGKNMKWNIKETV